MRNTIENGLPVNNSSRQTALSHETGTVKIISRSTLLGKEIDVYGSAESPLFKAKDVADWIQHSNITDFLSLVDDDEKGVRNCLTPGGNQKAWFLTEDGLYEVLMQSRKPIARQFKKGVKEILKSIRKTGGYSAQQYTLPQTYLEALKALVASEEEKQKLALENRMMKPKAEYFDNLVERSLLTNLRDTAKQIHIPQNRFVSLLLEHKFVYRDARRRLKPYAEYTPLYFEIKDFERNGHSGTQMLVTPKGKETFRLMRGGAAQ